MVVLHNGPEQCAGSFGLVHWSLKMFSAINAHFEKICKMMKHV